MWGDHFDSSPASASVMMDCQPVLFIDSRDAEELSLAFAVPFEQPDETLFLRLRWIAPAGGDTIGAVEVVHDLHRGSQPELATSVHFTDDTARIDSSAGSYLLDVSRVSPRELAAARAVLRKMQPAGVFCSTWMRVPAECGKSICCQHTPEPRSGPTRFTPPDSRSPASIRSPSLPSARFSPLSIRSRGRREFYREGPVRTRAHQLETDYE